MFGCSVLETLVVEGRVTNMVRRGRGKKEHCGMANSSDGIKNICKLLVNLQIIDEAGIMPC